MKRYILPFSLMMVSLLMAVMSYASDIGSGEKTATGVVVAKECEITSLQIITDGTNDAKVILYDNASAASGRVITEMTIAGGDNFGGRYFNDEMCLNGIYAVVTGTGASFIVGYHY